MGCFDLGKRRLPRLKRCLDMGFRRSDMDTRRLERAFRGLEKELRRLEMAFRRIFPIIHRPDMNLRRAENDGRVQPINKRHITRHQQRDRCAPQTNERATHPEGQGPCVTEPEGWNKPGVAHRPRASRGNPNEGASIVAPSRATFFNPRQTPDPRPARGADATPDLR